jgi:hypothetical protein
MGHSLVLAQESVPTPKPDVVIASDTKTEFQVQAPNGGWAPASLVSFSAWPEIPGAKWIWSSSSVSQQEAMYGSRICSTAYVSAATFCGFGFFQGWPGTSVITLFRTISAALSLSYL